MKFIASVIISVLALNVGAQSPEWDQLSAQHKEIVQVVIDVFDGMRAGDSAMVKAHFYPQPSANTAFYNKEGEPQFRVDDINNWFNAIAKPHDQVWDERLWDYKVRVDLNLATVWVRYAFYLDDEFHHCGVDALQLAYDGARWKIFHIADTRQVEGCDIPDRIAAGAKF